MSEIYNYAPEFVSGDELLVLADFYTKQIQIVREQIARLPPAACQGEEHKKLQTELFRLFNRRYYIRICHRARNHS